MLTSTDFYRRYGHPESYRKWMIVWDVPTELEIGFLPNKLYCNRDLVKPLEQAFRNLIERGYVNEIKSWDGCWNFRAIRGNEKKYANLMKAGKMTEAIKLLSVHSWACAIDVNASENGLGAVPKLSAGFVKCFTDAGFVWGGTFSRKDGMHFQLAAFPMAA